MYCMRHTCSCYWDCIATCICSKCILARANLRTITRLSLIGKRIIPCIIELVGLDIISIIVIFELVSTCWKRWLSLAWNLCEICVLLLVGWVSLPNDIYYYYFCPNMYDYVLCWLYHRSKKCWSFAQHSHNLAQRILAKLIFSVVTFSLIDVGILQVICGIQSNLPNCFFNCWDACTPLLTFVWTSPCHPNNIPMHNVNFHLLCSCQNSICCFALGPTSTTIFPFSLVANTSFLRLMFFPSINQLMVLCMMISKIFYH